MNIDTQEYLVASSLERDYMLQAKEERLNRLLDDFDCPPLFLDDEEFETFSNHLERVGLMPKEFYDIGFVLEMGAKKYTPNGWLDKNGVSQDRKSTYASMHRHLSQSLAGIDLDDESGQDHLLHLACRALMLYTRKKRNIVHELDEGK